MKKIKRIGVLTSGGDAPGLNGVIRAVVKTAILKYKLEVVGIREGYEGLLMKDGFIPLTLRSVRGILPRGGTIIGTRNTGKYHVFFEEGATEEQKQKLLKQGIASLKRNRIDVLFAIGGDGSLTMAHHFHKAGFPVIGIPKTIDNDLAATDCTFGFDTAVQVATDALDRLTTTAESHDRVMILEVMGRDAGWIAAAAGIAGGADIILIPEIPFDVRKIAEYIKLRESTGAHSHIIIASEGAAPKNTKSLYVETADGQKRHGGIAQWLEKELHKHIKNEVRSTVLGHIQRGGTPTAFDRILATRFGAYAVNIAMEGRHGEMVCLRTPDIKAVPLAQAISVYHLVDPFSGIVRTGRSIGISFGD